MMVGLNINRKVVPLNNNYQVEHMDRPVPACKVVEEILLGNVLPDGMISYDDPEHNVNIYSRLVQEGCQENRAKYEALVQRERQIIDSLRRDNTRNCLKIEDLLRSRIYNQYSPNAADHVEFAKIYANLSERGCPENSQKYVDLAKQELDIARALQDDNMSNDETIEVVETYKRIRMQKEAQEFLDKAKKIANPAIDFIIELEKIINE